jgi:hypothetical protein
MIKNPIIKEKAWLSPEVERLLGKGTLETMTSRHGWNYSLKSDRLAEIVNLLIKSNDVKRIVETGSFDGSGTTMTYAKTGLPVHSCEAHKQRFLNAKARLAHHRNVFLSHAFTTLEEDISPNYRESLGPENSPSESGWLAAALENSESGESLLVSLDSGGEVGINEATVFIEWLNAQTSPRTVSLILDDIHTEKHRSTVPKLEETFGVDVYQVEDRWGFTVIEIKPAG